MANGPLQLAQQRGLKPEFEAAQALRHGLGLADSRTLLAVVLPQLQSLDHDRQLVDLKAFISQLPRPEQSLARVHWNCWDDTDSVTWDWQVDYVSLAYLERCRRAVEDPRLPFITNERMARERNDFLALELAEHLARRRSSDSVRVSVTRSQRAYKELILHHEADAQTIDRIPKRIAEVFKHVDTVRAIADMRFGPGSSNYNHYVEEHALRQAQTFAALEQGTLQLREIYSTDDLRHYLTFRDHGSSVELEIEQLHLTVSIWLDALMQYDSYLVAITDQPTPMKYQIIDGNAVVFHEAIGRGDGHRLNAVLIESKTVAQEFTDDFELLWDATPISDRDKGQIVDSVRSMLDA